MASKNPTVKFSPTALKRAFALAKLVKPKTGDYVLKVENEKLAIISYDARKYVRAEVRPETHALPEGYVSDEFFLSEDRRSLLESDLEHVEISVTDKGMNVRSWDNHQGKNRKAVIRRRPANSRRPAVPKPINPSGGLTIPACVLEELLRHLTCSALVKETKTEDDMRLNQVHFYAEHGCAFANARSHATVVKYPGLNLNCSIVSSDIPLIKGFCSKFGDADVEIGQDDKHLFVRDPVTGSCVFAGRVNAKRPDFSLDGLEEDLFSTKITVAGDDFNTSVDWAVTAVEGTARITFSTEAPSKPSVGNADMVLSADGQEVSRFPVTVEDGSSPMRADFHIGCMATISPYLTQGKAVLRYGHKTNPSLLDISLDSRTTRVSVRHFIRSMKPRSL